MTRRRQPRPSTITLAATALEAEALVFARTWIGRLREGTFLDSPHGPLDPAAAHWFVRQRIKQYVEWHPQNATRMVEAAVLGWDEADVALRELILEKRHRREPLGDALGFYLDRAVTPGGGDIPDHGGKSKVTNQIQDIAIATLVLNLIERFPPLKANRFQAGKKRRPSACSIVADALTAEGMHRGDEKAIQVIWRRYGPIISHGYLWPDWGRRSLGLVEGPAGKSF